MLELYCDTNKLIDYWTYSVGPSTVFTLTGTTHSTNFNRCQQKATKNVCLKNSSFYYALFGQVTMLHYFLHCTQSYQESSYRVLNRYDNTKLTKLMNKKAKK